jgi:hypothetical protein
VMRRSIEAANSATLYGTDKDGIAASMLYLNERNALLETLRVDVARYMQRRPGCEAAFLSAQRPGQAGGTRSRGGTFNSTVNIRSPARVSIHASTGDRARRRLQIYFANCDVRPPRIRGVPARLGGNPKGSKGHGGVESWCRKHLSGGKPCRRTFPPSETVLN